jgi:hypothetical protein
MFKYFGVVTGFATLVGTSCALLEGTPRYTAISFSFAFSFFTLVLWCKSDRARQLKATLRPSLEGHLKKIGSDMLSPIAGIARHTGMQDEVADILTKELKLRPDPTERYWIYIALGNTGGKKAAISVKKGLSDDHEFARSGAKIAWESLQARKPPARRKRRLYTVTLLSSAIIAATVFIMDSLTPEEAQRPLIHHTSPPPLPQPRGNEMTILIEWGEKGNIWIYLFDDTGDSTKFGITPNSPPPSRCFEIRM